MATELEKKIAVLETRLSAHITESNRRDDELQSQFVALKQDYQRELTEIKQNKDNMQRDYSNREFSKNNLVVNILVGLLSGVGVTILSFFLSNLGGK